MGFDEDMAEMMKDKRKKPQHEHIWHPLTDYARAISEKKVLWVCDCGAYMWRKLLPRKEIR